MANGGGPGDRCAPVVPDEDDRSVVERIGDDGHVPSQLAKGVPLDLSGNRAAAIAPDVEGGDPVATVGEVGHLVTP